LKNGDYSVDSKYFEKISEVETEKLRVSNVYVEPKIEEMKNNINCGEMKTETISTPKQSINPSSDPKLFYAVNLFDLSSTQQISITKNCNKCEKYYDIQIHSSWKVNDLYDWHPGETAGGVYDDWAKFLHNCNWAKEFEVTSIWTEDKSDKIPAGSPTNCDVPEFPTVALPVISVLGLLFLLRRRI